jgi:hypothetical protein
MMQVESDSDSDAKAGDDAIQVKTEPEADDAAEDVDAAANVDASDASDDGLPRILKLRPLNNQEPVEPLDLLIEQSPATAKRGRNWFADLRAKTLALSEREWKEVIASASAGHVRMLPMEFYRANVLWANPVNGFLGYFRHTKMEPRTWAAAAVALQSKTGAWAVLRPWLDAAATAAADSDSVSSGNMWPIPVNAFHAYAGLYMNALVALQVLVVSPLMATLAQSYMDRAWALEPGFVLAASASESKPDSESATVAFETLLGHHALILIYALSNGAVRSRGDDYRLGVAGLSSEEQLQMTEIVVALLALNRAIVPTDIAALPYIQMLMNMDRVLIGHSYKPFLRAFWLLVFRHEEDQVYRQSLAACVTLLLNAISRLRSIPQLAALLVGVPSFAPPVPRVVCPRCGCNEWKSSCDGTRVLVRSADLAEGSDNLREADYLKLNVLSRMGVAHVRAGSVLACSNPTCVAKPSDMLVVQRCVRLPVIIPVGANLNYFLRLRASVAYKDIEVGDVALTGERCRYHILSIVVAAEGGYRIVRLDAHRRKYYAVTVHTDGGSELVRRASLDELFEHPFDALDPIPAAFWGACVVFERQT